MKLIKEHHVDGKHVYVNVTWGDHHPGCPRCREVDLSTPPSFVKACAQGSALIAEEMMKRQAPINRANAEKVRAWAKEAGVFKMK